MKKVIIYALSISALISFCGCIYNLHDISVKSINQESSSFPSISTPPSSPSSTNEDSKNTGGNEQNKSKIGIFYLGMKYEDLMKLDLYNTDNEITENKVIDDDKNDLDYGNRAVWTQKLCCLFNKNNNLYSITVNGDIPTSLGLKIGDIADSVEKLYGKYDYQYKYTWGIVFEYNRDGYYFDISIQDNQVFLWGISKYKYDYNGNYQSTESK